ncbi:MAG TPA: AsmA family protein [Novosphingobium sp.]|nr:AsmA family protein [Novosphingobium sp.]
MAKPGPLRRVGLLLLRVLVGVVGLLFAIWLVLFITKGRFLRQPFEQFASSAMQRKVTVGGEFNLYFAPFDIAFRADDIAIENPVWAHEKRFFTARHLGLSLRTLPLLWGQRRMAWLALDGSRVAPEWDKAHQHNSWTFGDPSQPGKPLDLPDIERGRITGTSIAYRDPLMQLFAAIGVDTIQATHTRIDNAIGFNGTGSLRGAAVRFNGRVLDPEHALSGGRADLALHAQGLRTIIDVAGTLPTTTGLKGSDLQMSVRGHNMADLFDFMGVAAMPTRRYHLVSKLTYDGHDWRFTGIEGTFGDSDIAGSLTIGMPRQRLDLRADLHTRSLDLIDAAPFIGYDPDRLDKMGKAGLVQQVNGRPRLLPDAPLRIDAVSRFDAHVRYRVDAISARDVPISNIDATLDLDHSLLRLSPLRAVVATGQFTGHVTLDARQPTVLTDYDLHLAPTPMGKLLARFGVEEAGTSGTLAARVEMRGTGNSLRDSLASANGRMVFIVPAGTMWARNVQLAELDIGTFVQKMFEKKLKEPVQINCGLLGFTVRNGVSSADPILIDTKKNVITGRGNFSFRDESIDLSLRADSKTFSLFSLQSPVGVDGYFAKPGIDVITPQLLARGGVAAGLGVLVNPFAALIAFIDPGDAKAAACGPVLTGAKAAQQRTLKGKPRKDVGDGGPRKGR